MDDEDMITGEFITQIDSRALNFTLPPFPMDTNPTTQSVIQKNFPEGSPNVIVDAPWVKHVSTCTFKHDSHLTHYFQNTKFVWSNDLCTLGAGKYTWLITEDNQISFGKYLNNYELGTKHSNIAMKRAGYAGGELVVAPGTIDAKHTIGWNLESGTYTKTICKDMNQTDPDYYLDNYLLPKVTEVWKTTPCYENMYYWDTEFFIPVLPSVEYVSWLCANNFFAKENSSIVWDEPFEVSICEDWGRGVCIEKSRN